MGIAPSDILTLAVAATIPPEAQASVIRHNLLPRVGRREDIAKLVAFLVSNETSFISGVAIAVDGDLTPHFPTYAEELDARARSLAVMDMQR
jgi:NAD(P)-dependent dehydrogenase (short-subunit alcohol dehydrogenase family)